MDQAMLEKLATMTAEEKQEFFREMAASMSTEEVGSLQDFTSGMANAKAAQEKADNEAKATEIEDAFTEMKEIDDSLKEVEDAAKGADLVADEAIDRLKDENPEVFAELAEIEAKRQATKDGVKEARTEANNARQAVKDTVKEDYGYDFDTVATKSGRAKTAKKSVSGNGGGGAKVLYPELDGSYPDNLSVQGGEFFHGTEKISAQKWISLVSDGLGMDMEPGGGIARKGDSGPRKAKQFITRYRAL